MIELKLAKLLILKMADVNVMNESNSMEDIASILDGSLRRKIKKDLTYLTNFEPL